MTLLDVITGRRSIRKYLDTKVERDKLDKILQAGLYAPNPGGRQGTRIIILNDAKLVDKIGVINAACENRNWSFSVSREQPSIIDDLSIRSGFYGSPALGIICIPKSRATQVNAIGSAFVCAENMVLEAYELGISTCIVGRAEATFSNKDMHDLLTQWGLDYEYTPIVFVCMGYIDGKYPEIKPRFEGRAIYIGEELSDL